jgi:hypothetical protein
MDPIERWKLAEELTVYQIALLLAAYDPSEFAIDEYDDWQDGVKKDIAPFVTSIKHAVCDKKIIAKFDRYGEYGDGEIKWETTNVDIVSLRQWLISRNYTDGYFIRDEAQVDKLVDPSGEFYAPKLAAAVRAWREVTADPEATKGKTPKKALEVWLRKHANEYGLTNEDGNPNKLGIEEICKVANWKPAGGASPTPVSASTRPTSPNPQEDKPTWARKVRPNSPTPRPRPLLSKIDDDIPF